MRGLTAISLVFALGAGAAHAATPAEVICASYKSAMAKEPDRAKREAMARSLPRGCEVKAPPRKPAEPVQRKVQAAPSPKPVPMPEAAVPMPAQAPEPAPAPVPMTPMPNGVTVEQANKNGNKAYQSRNFGEAMRWFRISADHGDSTAQADVGELYFHGHGVAVDYGQALIWYRRSAAQGNAAAQDSIGALYARGQGVKVDYVEAIRWFRLAAAQGYADAANWMGYFYSHGLGVEKNDSQAQNWYAKARADQTPR
jgi:hypothetical protein